MLLSAFLEGRRRSTHSINTRPRSSNTAGAPWLVFPESSRSGRRTSFLRWSRPLDVCRPYPARVRRLWGFGGGALVCLLRALRRSRSICDHARRGVRYYLAISVCRQRARATVSRRDAGVVRRRAAVVSAPTAATEWPRRHWYGCRSGGVLWLQVGGQRRSCTHASPQRCAPAKVGYERCRRTPKETPDRVSLHFRTRPASRQLASGCKDTSKHGAARFLGALTWRGPV